MDAHNVHAQTLALLSILYHAGSSTQGVHDILLYLCAGSAHESLWRQFGFIHFIRWAEVWCGSTSGRSMQGAAAPPPRDYANVSDLKRVEKQSSFCGICFRPQCGSLLPHTIE